jgi:hypothetical protein
MSAAHGTTTQSRGGVPVYKRRRRRIYLGSAVAAAVVIALVLSTSTSPTVNNIRTTVSHDAQSAINSLSNLISQYTK